jgi:hypothetical protein
MNPKRPPYISMDNWYNMSRKEKDYIQLLSEKKRTKDEIKRKLYIATDSGFWRFRKRVVKYIDKINGKKK